MTFWTAFWFYWLLTIAITFLPAEALSWYFAGGAQWTLSDTIRRWAKAHHWLPMVVWGVAVALCVHWFG
jgi:hypothetical protein